MTTPRIVHRKQNCVDPDTVKELLKKLHVTRRDAAELAGVSLSHFNKYMLTTSNARPFPDERFDRMLTMMKRRFGLRELRLECCPITRWVYYRSSDTEWAFDFR